jgi:hypothetical protein
MLTGMQRNDISTRTVIDNPAAMTVGVGRTDRTIVFSLYATLDRQTALNQAQRIL